MKTDDLSHTHGSAAPAAKMANQYGSIEFNAAEIAPTIMADLPDS
ncbi:MAG: hypothetical protein Q7T86_06675 [Hyphomicrobiaceae bacterium]|nr:hypothetical protein [Hyphomicrobiaceae bacterium]